jgi:hypothetical protein
MFITEYARNKWDMDGHVALATVSLAAAVLYTGIALLAPDGTIEAAIAYAGNSGLIASTLYNFLKAKYPA